MKSLIAWMLVLSASLCGVGAADSSGPVRFAIFGLSHDHAGGFIPRAKDRTDIQLVGIIEPREDLVSRYAERFHLDRALFFPSLDSLLARTNIQAVATFTSTFEHRRVVELCAAKGLHVLMEKPLAVNMEHARAMESAATRAGVQLIVNYETTWYPGNQAAYDLVHQDHALGELRKIVVHDGHRGPKEIGCSAAFLEWLTDPKLNGGGALTDFGCYGADLITWLMQGQRPTSVLAVTQHFKPDVYTKVRYIGFSDDPPHLPGGRKESFKRRGIGRLTAKTWRFTAPPVMSWFPGPMSCVFANRIARRRKLPPPPCRVATRIRSLTCPLSCEGRSSRAGSPRCRSTW